LVDVSIKLGLALRHEFAERISRTEVEEMHQIVMAELDHIQKGCVSTIVGGYRRGKPESNDVDIVITHPDSRKAAGIGKKLIRRLYEQGLVTHVMHLSGFHKPQALRTTKGTLETILTVFILPPNESRLRVHRRLDLIFALPEVYWTAITGWTGSTMFQRDLRLWCKEKGLKFDSSGITRRHDSKRFYPKSEVEVFEMVGLEWIDPTLRNADV
jgi:DNA polymerase mu